jgi:hypothetical protein
MDSKEQAILKTLLYGDIFNYPLKKQEIFKFLITHDKISRKALFSTLNKTSEFREFKKGYYFLKNRQNLVRLRQKKEDISLIKLRKAENIIKNFSFIPLLKFVGISGSLSMRNSNEDDDIDIFVITEKGLVWSTRFLLAVLLILMGVYRYKGSKDYKDKICLNLIIDEDNMAFVNKSKNLYTAHEISQLVPVLDRDNTYGKFIKQNDWVTSFLPNSNLQQTKALIKKRNGYKSNLIINFMKTLKVEKILNSAQLAYMNKSITSEKIREGFLGFHPFDYQSYILNQYRKKLTNHKIQL